jgi:hypothetical protein
MKSSTARFSQLRDAAAKAHDFAEAIKQADEPTLKKIGRDLASTALPEPLKKALRELYGKRTDELREVA